MDERMQAPPEADLRGRARDSTAIDDHRATIPGVFSRIAVHTRNAPAIVGGAATLTYAELDERSTLLAKHLRALGVGPDVLVGVCLPRAVAAIVALLAVLKAGGAYLPLDPGYPTQRLALMLRDAAPRVVLTRTDLREHVPPCAAEIVLLDRFSDGAPLVAEVCDASVAPDNLAYVVYTSGSTGVPKGVAATHRNVTRLVLDAEYVELAGATVLHMAPLAFDAATFEIWGPLLNGGAIALAGEKDALDAQHLKRLLVASGVGKLFVTTALFNRLTADCPDVFAGVDEVLFGGEAVSVPAVRALLSGAPPRRLVHVYGPTEAVTFATAYAIAAVDPSAATIPIGRAITSTQAYVLRPGLELASFGEAGELYLTGDGLARGYLHAPAVTSEKFVPNPFGLPGARMYRTGDIVRLNADGEIEFIGRADHQVKVRGFRVELGEVETALRKHPGVADAVVVARGEGDEKQLVAFVVCAEAQVSVTALRSHMSGLPAYMLPHRIVGLQAMPLNANGKVDRAALPVLDGRPELDTLYEAPRTPLEVGFADVWARVLKLDRVGVHDNFFDLGGHSLLASQMVALAREQLGIQTPLRLVFEHPTVAELAKALIGTLEG
jgi:amino acid adenylation domain-containing protein